MHMLRRGLEKVARDVQPSSRRDDVIFYLILRKKNKQLFVKVGYIISESMERVI